MTTFDDLGKDELLVMRKLLEVRDRRVFFATKCHRSAHGEKMDFSHNQHLVPIYNSLARKLVLQGSVQSMKSEMMIIDHLAMAACGLSVFFILPKIEMRNTYVQSRVNKRISESPEYRRLLSKGDFDNTAIKNFGKGVIKYVGSNELADFREFPCLTLDTRVATPSGAKPLGVLRSGDAVWSFDTDGHIVCDEVLAFLPKGLKPTIRLSTSEGRSVDCTADHLFWTPRGWRPAGALRVGDTVNVVASAPPSSGAGGIDHISQIENCGLREVADITVRKNPTFFANGLAVHNCDAIFVEEASECNATNLEYAIDRVRASRYQFARWVGNPRERGKGINKFFEMSNQHVWHLVCPKCKEPIALDWFQTVVNQKFDDDGNPTEYWLLDTDWTPHCGRDVYPMCPKCAVPLDRLSSEGLWIPQNPKSDMDGFLMTMLNSRFNFVADMVTAFDVDWHEGNMAHFFNSCLGIPFVSETARLTTSLMRKAAYIRDPYRVTIQREYACVANDCSKGPCSMGVDVGKKFDVRISEVDRDGTRRLVFVGKVVNLDDLVQLARRYNVFCIVIDSMPEYRVVEELMAVAPCFVWSCRYSGEGSDARFRKDKKARMLLIDRTAALDKSLHHFKQGKNLLPENFSAILDGQYVEEMTFPVRQEEIDKSGNVRYIWTHGKDHARHADVYDFLAASMLPSKDALAGVFVG